MAILKTFKGTTIGSTNNSYWFGGSYATQYNRMTLLGNNNYALVEDSNDTTLYLAESANDSVSMVPFYEKTLPFSQQFKKNVSHDFSSSLIYTNHPRLNAKFNYVDLDTDEEIFSSQIMNHSFNSNLDIDDAYNISNYVKFNIGAETYHLFQMPDRDGLGGGTQGSSNTYNTSPNSSLILAKGANLNEAEYVIFKSDTKAFNILSVNTDEQVIYLKGTFGTYRNASDSEYIFNYGLDHLYALPFNTIANQGEFSFGELKDLLIETGSYVNTLAQYGNTSTLSYLGRALDKDCFALFGNTPNSSNQLVVQFFKIDYNQLATATTYTDADCGNYKFLDCFETHSVLLDADPAVLLDYARQHNLTPTKCYNFDPTTPNQYWFYLPYFRNNGNLTPIAVNWDKSELIFADSFTFHYDILSTKFMESVTAGDTSNITVNPGSLTPAMSNDYGSAFFANYKASITQGEYLHFGFNFIDKAYYDEIYPLRSSLLINNVSFAIDTSSPETIVSYINKTQVPSLNSYLLKDDSGVVSELAVISPSSLNFYFYNSASGWVLSHSESGTFSEFSLDSYGRRWAIEAPVLPAYDAIIEHSSAYVYEYDSKLHLISQTLPRSTSVEFQDTSIVYSGTPISNSLLVNAYDHLGNRIEADVIVIIEGSNMQFTNGGGTEASATTSTNGDTVIPVTITGPGYVNVTVSYNF